MSGGRFIVLVLVLAAVGLLGGWLLQRCRVDQPAARAGRVVCLGPAAVEIVFAMGQADQLVAVDNYCSYPPEVQQLARVGGLTDPNLEGILAKQPGVIITMGKNPRLQQLANTIGARLLFLKIDTLGQLDRGIAQLGTLLGAVDQARQLREQITDRLGQVKRFVGGMFRPRVFFYITYSAGKSGSLTTIGGGGFLNQLIDIAGGTNIFGDLARAYPQVSREQVLLGEPDLIVLACPGVQFNDDAVNNVVRQWRQAGLPQRVPVHVLQQDYLLTPGPRVAKAAAVLAETFHLRSGVDN